MRHRLIMIVVAGCVIGCQSEARTVANEHGLTEPTRLCRAGAPSVGCRRAEAVEALLERDDLEILGSKQTTSGVQRARVLTLRSGGVVFRAKWRAQSTATRRNNPRYELAAYAVQKLFLPPAEYVVPPTAAHCFPLDAYRARVDAAARPTFERSRCVYGILSYWLEDVTSVPDAQRAGWFHGLDNHAFDPKLFARDRTYRDSIARVNLLTYLIGHRDSHARNFVIARDGSHDSVYSIDNSLAFTMAKNPHLQPRHDWAVIRVPALPRVAIDRLRAAQRSSLAVDWTGDRLAVGLTPVELAGVRARIAALLARIDRGELALY